ncbi:uncharacterized protein LOC113318118 isoform X3 [Papaver somniferum]|uniref:uncharacterized protein LOC113318118 isoform X3 n=1 Tax=Papaver somniferum TaxID=3469 RepID=UPI000E7011E9|nr:uncharacterized protein LOC113318118 isoform X3 [Papaver somniferum]
MRGITMMNSFLQASSAAVFSKTITRNPLLGFSNSSSSWITRVKYACIKTTSLDNMFMRFGVQYYSSAVRKSSSRKSKKLGPEAVVVEKEAFYVVRKGDVVGVYKSLIDCQAQVGSVCDPSVSVFKGYSLPKETEEYLCSRGLRNAVYTLSAVDVKEDLFEKLVPCPFEDINGSTIQIAGPSKISKQPSTEEQQGSCFVDFDGAAKGNPGPAGAGAIIRSEDGRVLCRLREGVGIATNNVAEYRAMLLGVKYALKKGFKRVSVRGDSKLICMQVQGIWKTKSENMKILCKEAKELKEQFDSFKILHVLRDLNSAADAEANLAVLLAEGQIEEDCQ